MHFFDGRKIYQQRSFYSACGTAHIQILLFWRVLITSVPYGRVLITSVPYNMRQCLLCFVDLSNYFLLWKTWRCPAKRLRVIKTASHSSSTPPRFAYQRCALTSSRHYADVQLTAGNWRRDNWRLDNRRLDNWRPDNWRLMLDTYSICSWVTIAIYLLANSTCLHCEPDLPYNACISQTLQIMFSDFTVLHDTLTTQAALAACWTTRHKQPRRLAVSSKFYD